MKKLTPADHITIIFSSESLDTCDVLLDVAQGILKQRRGVAPKKTRKPKHAADEAQAS